MFHQQSLWYRYVAAKLCEDNSCAEREVLDGLGAAFGHCPLRADLEEPHADGGGAGALQLGLYSRHTANPEAPVVLLASGEWTPLLLQADPAVPELRLVWSRRTPFWMTPSRWSAQSWLRAHRGPIYVCDPDVWAARIVEHARIPEDRLVRAWQHWPGNDVHWADWWLDVAQLDAPAVPGPARRPDVPARPRLHVPDEWHAQTRQWLLQHGLNDQPLVLLQPGHKKTHKRGRIATATHDKHWPAERWGAVIRSVLAELPGAAALVCGSSREAPLVQEIVDAAGKPAAGGCVVNSWARACQPRARWS